MAVNDPVLTIRALSMTFPGQRALSNVSFDVAPGEIHALVGENGSGKSTLIKCLAGFHRPDPGGRIEIGGVEVQEPHTSAQALDMGCGFVHQDLGLIPTLSVLENIALSHGFKTRAGRIRWRQEAARAKKLLDVFGADISPKAIVGDLSVAQQTLVAIARGLRDAETGGCLLVLDEPTASLPASEVEVLFEALHRVAENGIGIIYVSHRLGEVFQISNRISVLRDGELVGTWPTAELDRGSLIEKILGRPLEEYLPDPTSTVRDDVLLRVEELSGRQVKNVSFELHEGEVVGVAGLLASGRSELARLVTGAQEITSGRVVLDGESLSMAGPKSAIEAGIFLIPEDRRGSGSHPDMTVAENITINGLRSFSPRGRIRKRIERREVKGLIERFDVRPPDPGRIFKNLSGGNQQKVVMAKWMRLGPRVLVLDEPVQGVDIGSTTQIYGHIEQAASEGMGVLMIDSEFDDLCRLCDRILVMRHGEIVDVLQGAAKTRDRIFDLVYFDQEAK